MKEVVAGFITMAALVAAYFIFNPAPPVAVPAPVVQPAREAGFNYAALFQPILQAAFSPLDPRYGKLANAPLLTVRQHLLESPSKPGAQEASQLCDQLLQVLALREKFRQKFNSSIDEGSSKFFNEKIEHDWLAQSNAIAPPLQRVYADLTALQAQNGIFTLPIPGGLTPYYEPAPDSADPVFSGAQTPHAPVSVVHGHAVYLDQYGHPINSN